MYDVPTMPSVTSKGDLVVGKRCRRRGHTPVWLQGPYHDTSWKKCYPVSLDSYRRDVPYLGW